MPASTGHLKRFAYTIWQDWLALMSGIASVILASIGTFYTNAPPAWLFWVASVVCVVVASYRVWLRECQRADAADAKIAELERPDLSCLKKALERAGWMREWLTGTSMPAEQKARKELPQWLTDTEKLIEEHCPQAVTRMGREQVRHHPTVSEDEPNSALLMTFLNEREATLKSLLREAGGTPATSR